MHSSPGLISGIWSPCPWCSRKHAACWTHFCSRVAIKHSHALLPTPCTVCYQRTDFSGAHSSSKMGHFLVQSPKNLYHSQESLLSSPTPTKSLAIKQSQIPSGTWGGISGTFELTISMPFCSLAIHTAGGLGKPSCETGRRQRGSVLHMPCVLSAFSVIKSIPWSTLLTSFQLLHICSSTHLHEILVILPERIVSKEYAPCPQVKVCLSVSCLSRSCVEHHEIGLQWGGPAAQRIASLQTEGLVHGVLSSVHFGLAVWWPCRYSCHSSHSDELTGAAS